MNNSPLGLSNPQFWGDALSTIGTSLLGLGAGRNDWGLLGMQALQQRQQDRLANSRQAQQDAQQAQLFEFQKKKFEAEQAAAQKAQEQQQAKIAQFQQIVPTLPANLQPIAQAMGPDFLDQYGKLQVEQAFPKPQGPNSSVAKAAADLKAGLIDQATYDALVRKETYITPQTPRDTFRTLSDAEEKQMGLDPAGTYQMGSNGKVDVVNAPKSNQVLTQVGTNPDGSPIMDFVAVGGKPPTESELKGAGLLEKALPELDTAVNNFDALTSPKDMAAGSIPVLGNALQSEGYQRGRNSIKTISAAYLYSVSGAQAPESEVQRTMEEVMPKFGDGPSTLADKKARLQNMVDSIKIKAGRAAPLGQQQSRRLKYNPQTGELE